MSNHHRVKGFLLSSCDAVAITNEFLIVTGFVASLSVVMMIVFNGNISAMSDALAEINQWKKDRLDEKLEVISIESNYPSLRFVMTNYGKFDTFLTAVIDGGGNALSCTTNNSDPSSLVIPSGQLLEITCQMDSFETKFFAISQTRNIFEIQL